MKLDIIISVFNNEKTLLNDYEKLVNELKGIKYNILFVDNGSVDNSLTLLKEIYKKDYSNVKIIELSRRFDHLSSMIAGLNYSKSDYVCFYDLKYNPSYITKMLSQLEEHKECDSICMCNKIDKLSFVNKVLAKLVKSTYHYNIVDGQTDYRIINASMRDAILKYSKNNKINNIVLNQLGFNTYYDKLKSSETIKLDNNYFNIFDYFNKYSFPCLYFGLSNFIVSIIYLIICLLIDKLDSSLFLILLINGINFIFLSFIVKSNRKDDDINYIIKHVIGFDEEYL